MQIRKVTVENFRSFSDFTWLPNAGLNVVLGAGDTGKTTLLEAIALALSPQPSQAAIETDYRDLDTSQPFDIEMILGRLSEAFLASVYPPPLWGWDAGTGTLHPAPNEDQGYEPVVCIKVTGSPDLELVHQLVQPGSDPRPLTVAMRAAVGLWNVNTTRSPDSQLRMARGSLLERAIGRDRMRAPAVAAMQDTARTLQIPDDAVAAVAQVAEQLRTAGIRFDNLALSMVPGSGQSPVQLVTLVAQVANGHVPLANFGRGSQQMAMVTLAAADVVDAPVAVIDEIEAGLEPYRQRALLAKLRTMLAKDGQAFITSHSPAILGKLKVREAWKMSSEPAHSITPLEGDVLRLMKRDPEAMLSKLTVICEGQTEVGVLEGFFEFDSKVDPGVLGIHLADGIGHEDALRFIEGLAQAGQHVFGLVDCEEFKRGTRLRLASTPNVRLCESTGGRCIEVAVARAIPLDRLDALVALPGTGGDKLNIDDRLQAISARLGQQSRSTVAQLLQLYEADAVTEAVGESASKGGWYKTAQAGKEFARFLIDNAPGDSRFAADLRALVRDILCTVGSLALSDAPSDGAL